MFPEVRKINALEVGPPDDCYLKDIVPLITAANIPIFAEETISFLRLNDAAYWGQLMAINDVFIARVDHRHWYATDSDFKQYVKKISNVYFPCVRICDYPWSYEQLNYNFFEKKLHERMRFLADAIKSNNSQCMILSPFITADLAKSDVRSTAMNFFTHNRDLMDAYSMDCRNSGDNDTSALTSVLKEVLGILAKPVYVARWGVASHQGVVFNDKAIRPSTWIPMSHAEAVNKLKFTFETINAISQNIWWFWSELGQDEYNPSGSPPNLWSSDKFADSPRTWDYRHFTGLIKHNGHIKQPVLNEFLRLAKQYNSQ